MIYVRTVKWDPGDLNREPGGIDEVVNKTIDEQTKGGSKALSIQMHQPDFTYFKGTLYKCTIVFEKDATAVSGRENGWL